jgi:hypothetical protein
VLRRIRQSENSEASHPGRRRRRAVLRPSRVTTVRNDFRDRAARRSRLFLGAAVIVLPGLATIALATAPAGASGVESYTFTTVGETLWTVPQGATTLQVSVLGAAGSPTNDGGAPSATSGSGADVQATIPAPAGGTVLYVEVGGVGQPGSGLPYGGGGSSVNAGGGGGASDVQTCSVGADGCVDTADPASDPRLVVAGGGGGGGEDGGGTATGGGTGGSADGNFVTSASGAGGAGTDSGSAGAGGGTGYTTGVGSAGSPGPGGASCSVGPGTAGTPGQGGNGGAENGADSGGGGGGGWVGGSGGGTGGAGCAFSGGGGGGGGAGLSFVESSASGISVSTAGTATSDGEVVITVTPFPPTITSPASTTFNVGQAGNFSVTTDGSPPPGLSDGGAALPSGVSFIDNGNGTATLSGTPAAGTGGRYSFTITASNGVAPDATQSFTLTVDQAPAITSAASTTFTSGHAGSFTVTTTGFPTSALSDGGATLPSGVTFVDNGNGTATLAGTPAAGTGAVYHFTVLASNGVAPDATQSFTLTIDQAPAVTSAASTTFTVGTAGTFTVTTTGFPTGASMSITETGALPSGVTLTNNNNGTATLSGTPAAGTGGTYSFTITASNGVGTNATQAFTLTVDQPPAITSAASTTFTVGTAGTFTVTTTGFPTSALSDGGATLPTGVTFADNHNGTATLAGTPAAGTGGVYHFTVLASNGVAPDATQSFTLTIDQAPAITSAAGTTFTSGRAGSFTVTTTGFPTSALSDGGATLPSGVTFVDNGNGTATLSGTPAAGTGGTYSFTITASNGASPNATQTFLLTVDQGPAITSAANTTFTAGTAGTFTVTTSGFPGGGSITISDGGATLPTGVTFTDNHNGTATLAGTPAAGTGGVYQFTVLASNGVAPDATQSFTLTIDQAPAVTSPASSTFTAGTAGTFTVTTTGFPTPALSDGGARLPSGVTFVDNGNGTATLSGTPAAGTGGTYSFTITASNGVATNATQAFTLTVDQGPTITSAASTTFTVGHSGSFTVTTTSFPNGHEVTISDGGAALPGGLTFTDNGNGTATLAGTPAAGTGGVYRFTIVASNGVGRDAVQSFTLTIHQAPAITSAASATFTVGQTGAFTVSTTGFPTSALSDRGAVLPSGLIFTDRHDGTAVLSGTPDDGTGGTYSFTIVASNGVAPNASQRFSLTVNLAPGYVIASSNGGVEVFGGALFKGSLPDAGVHVSDIVGVQLTGDGRGYWLVGADGGVFAFGDARFHGSLTGQQTAPVVGMAATPDGGGYWLVTDTGAVYGFGDAHYHGGLSSLSVSANDVVGITPSVGGQGYYLATTLGNVYTFGTARYHGGVNNLELKGPVVSISLDWKTGGYWMAGADGGVFAFDAPFAGSASGLPAAQGTVGLAPTPAATGYWLAVRGGSILPYGDAGSTEHLADIVGISSS